MLGSGSYDAADDVAKAILAASSSSTCPLCKGPGKIDSRLPDEPVWIVVCDACGHEWHEAGTMAAMDSFRAQLGDDFRYVRNAGIRHRPWG